MSEEQKENQPSREEIMKWYKDEIELAKLRAELAGLQRDATVAEAQRLHALVQIASITQPEKDQDKSIEEEETSVQKPRKLVKQE